MYILFVIDSLGSGGAQRQIVNLACGFKAKGHDVELFIYHPELDFYRKIINESGITVNEIYGVSGFSLKVVQALALLLRKKKFEALISFLPSPNIYSILACLYCFAKVKLIVSERSSSKGDATIIEPILRRILYVKTRSLTVNSYDHLVALKRYFWLKRKISVIYNGYSFSLKSKFIPNTSGKKISFIVVGRNSVVKNGVRLLEALLLFANRNGYVPNISWAGRQELDHKSLSVRAEMDRLIASNFLLQAGWQWLGERSDIPQLLSNSDALIHVSLYEGLPNVICEAFIEYKPVIASSVCDHPLLVEDGVRGFLCDPLSPESICYAIERFIALSPVERNVLGRNARRYAEEYLTLDRMVKEYEVLLN
jgi:glycosyltransferase involved in cell wall biosynthesis